MILWRDGWVFWKYGAQSGICYYPAQICSTFWNKCFFGLVIHQRPLLGLQHTFDHRIPILTPFFPLQVCWFYSSFVGEDARRRDFLLEHAPYRWVGEASQGMVAGGLWGLVWRGGPAECGITRPNYREGVCGGGNYAASCTPCNVVGQGGKW